jgi:hypothetical protein
MRHTVRAAVATLALLTLATSADARRVTVVHRPHHTQVIVHRGFPIHRTLPHVVVRAPLFRVRVAPRVFLPPVVFGAAIVATEVAAENQIWRGNQSLEKGDEWTEFMLDVDQSGRRLLLDISGGAAAVSFAEVVFENGDTQVVDFDDKAHAPGLYRLLDLEHSRKVDHVRVVARAEGDATALSLRLVG